MYCFTNTFIHTAFSSTASASRCHSALLADSSQLIAFIFLPLFLITVIDPSRSFRMTINISLIMTPCRPVSFWTGQKCFVRKMESRTMTRSEESMTLMTSYRLPRHGYRSFTFVQDDVFRSPSLWRFPFPITSDVLSSNRHSERRQACRMRKTGNGIVTQSEESIMLMTPYRFFSPR